MPKDLVAQTFIEMHNEEGHTERPIPGECPVCQILVKESLEDFRFLYAEKIEAIVDKMLAQWESLGYSIANKDPYILSPAIMDAILECGIQPKIAECNFEPSYLVHHPYVVKKNEELKNK